MADRRLCDKAAAIVLGLLAAASLVACASPHDSGGAESLPPGEWQEIPAAQADLNLAQSLPVKADAIYRRVDATQQVEDYYGFYGGAGIEGYVVTTRVPHGSLAEKTMLEMRQIRLLYYLVRDHPVTSQRQLEIGLFHGLKKDSPHTVGDYGTAESRNGQGQCFFGRLGKLLEQENKNGSYPGAIDTAVFAVLCGDDVNEDRLVVALEEAALAKP